MKLSEFVKKRRAELGLTWNEIMDGGIANNTFCNIVKGKQLTMKPATMEKLARLLKCTIGELQACMAETPNPLRAEAEKPEGNAGISITAGAGKSKKKTAPAPDPKDEEPAEVFKPEVEVFETDMQTAEEFKQELRWLFIKLASDIQVFDTPMHELTSVFGKAVLDRIAENEVHDDIT